MLTKNILWLIIFFSCIPLIAAEELTEITLFREAYVPGETVQAVVITSDPDKRLFPEQIALFRAPGQEMRIAPFLLKRDKNEYVIYFDLPTSLPHGTYSFEIEDVPYMINGVIEEVTSRKTVILQSSFEPTFAINPGFIFLKEGQKELSLTLESKEVSTDVTFNTTRGISHVYTTPQLVQKGTKRKFKFFFDPKIKVSESTIQVNYANSMYSVPVYPPFVEEKEGKVVLELLTSSSVVNHTVGYGKTMSGPLEVVNRHNETLYNVSIQLSGDLPLIVSTDISVIPEMAPGNVSSVFFWINRAKNASVRTYEGDLTVSAGSDTASLTMFLEIVSKGGQGSVVEENDTVVIKDDEKPPFLDITLDGDGTSPEKRKVSVGAVVLIVLIILAVIIFFIFRGVRKVERKTFDQFMQERNKGP